MTGLDFAHARDESEWAFFRMFEDTFCLAIAHIIIV